MKSSLPQEEEVDERDGDGDGDGAYIVTVVRGTSMAAFDVSVIGAIPADTWSVPSANCGVGGEGDGGNSTILRLSVLLSTIAMSTMEAMACDGSSPFVGEGATATAILVTGDMDDIGKVTMESTTAESVR